MPEQEQSSLFDRTEGIHYLTDYYMVLGVGRDADNEQIKDAYRKKAREYHPDRYEGLAPEMRAKAEFTMRMVNRANDILSNIDNREVYTNILSQWDGPISHDGGPVINLNRPYYGAETSKEAREYAEEINRLGREHMGFDPNRLEKIRKIHSLSQDEDTIDLLDEELLKKQTDIGFSEGTLRKILGVKIFNENNLPQDYLLETEEAIAHGRQQFEVRTEREVGLLGSGAMLMLAGTDYVLSHVNSNQQSLSDDVNIRMEAFDQRAEEILQLAEQKEEVIEERLELIKGNYLGQQEVLHERVIIGVIMNGKMVPMAFVRDGTNLTPDETLDPERLDIYFDSSKAEEAYKNGINVMTVKVKEGLPFMSVISQALTVHFMEKDKQDEMDNTD